MEYIESYFEVEWIKIEEDQIGNKKEIVYKEEFGAFNEALDYYLGKKSEDVHIVRLISVLMECRNKKD